MTIAEAKSQFGVPSKQTTLCYLRKDNSILLAMKKRGFGVGKWNGIGGKQDPSESIEDTMVRETQEEVGVTPKTFQKSAVLTFYFEGLPEDKNWNQVVHVYLCTAWDGEIQETEEMAPQWFNTEKLPYEQMWEPDKQWIPKVLKGEIIIGEFLFEKEQKLGDFSISKSN